MNYRNAKKKSGPEYNTIVVTGAAGFIGRYLIQRLKMANYRVIAVDNVSLRAGDPRASLRIIRCDITDKKGLRKLARIPGPVILVHLAAYVPHAALKEEGMSGVVLNSNITGCENILMAFKTRLAKVCYVSTLEVYGAPGSIPINEGYPANPQNIYGLSKLCAEHLVRMSCLKNRIPFGILRLSTVYGPQENYSRAVPNFIRAAIRNQPLCIHGDGSAIRDYLYIDDACDAIIGSINNRGSEGIVNIASGRGYSIKEVAGLIKRLSGSKSIIRFLKREKPDYDILFDISKAKRELGFKPKTALKDGLLSEINCFESSLLMTGRLT